MADLPTELERIVERHFCPAYTTRNDLRSAVREAADAALEWDALRHESRAVEIDDYCTRNRRDWQSKMRANWHRSEAAALRREKAGK